ncbi:type I restriction-modification system subunit M N-terminal domain-containing protein [Endozoicomonas sp. 4G]|uniref:type I restriction-modification system subunit M N-terminal domain-containing protein n=1 Tax=Endozoicomonas sp. 4G TaxID=2872754 RepID=UPI002078AAC6|nr:type I restriction-modification system subunit M N-terminal domain-containing protein [Endozoicomonas sp. 4G]
MSQSHNNLAVFIWSVADLLWGNFKQLQYGQVDPGLPRVFDGFLISAPLSEK